MVESRPLFTWQCRFFLLNSMTHCASGLLVASLHLVAPLLATLVDGIVGLLVKPQPLFTRWHRFFHLWLMSSGDFSQIATSFQLVALLLAPLVHKLWLLQSTCCPSSLVCSASCAFGQWRLWSVSSMVVPLHYAHLPAALLLEILVNKFLSSLQSAPPLLVPSFHGTLLLWSTCGISLLGGAASCAFG